MSSEDEREEKFDSTDPIVLRALVTGNFWDLQELSSEAQAPLFLEL